MDHSPFMLTAEAGYDGEPGGGMAVHGGGTRGDHGGEACFEWPIILLCFFSPGPAPAVSSSLTRGGGAGGGGIFV